MVVWCHFVQHRPLTLKALEMYVPMRMEYKIPGLSDGGCMFLSWSTAWIDGVTLRGFTLFWKPNVQKYNWQVWYFLMEKISCCEGIANCGLKQKILKTNRYKFKVDHFCFWQLSLLWKSNRNALGYFHRPWQEDPNKVMHEADEWVINLYK